MSVHHLLACTEAHAPSSKIHTSASVQLVTLTVPLGHASQSLTSVLRIPASTPRRALIASTYIRVCVLVDTVVTTVKSMTMIASPLHAKMVLLVLTWWTSSLAHASPHGQDPHVGMKSTRAFLKRMIVIGSIQSASTSVSESTNVSATQDMRQVMVVRRAPTSLSAHLLRV